MNLGELRSKGVRKMNSIMAFVMGEAFRGCELMVFDWDKAARLIKERKPKLAMAGLKDDFEWTGGTIYEDGKPVKDDFTYLSSAWATPILKLDYEEIPCYIMEHETNYNCHTKWPESALAIIAK